MNADVSLALEVQAQQLRDAMNSLLHQHGSDRRSLHWCSGSLPDRCQRRVRYADAVGCELDDIHDKSIESCVATLTLHVG